MRPLMIVGTASDVGKSVLATALCRIFRQDGHNPAPFKAQNMALNSAVTAEGGEIGRAQAVQAEAAGVEPHTDMNPVLLKPSSERTSQVIVDGRPVGNADAWEYFRGAGRERLRRAVHEAFDRLAARFDPVILEGAGSISELNLRAGDIVNMSMAEWADAAVVLVADIDRGGVFGSVYGTLALQSEADRARIKGIIINKFRGDLRLFDEGRAMLERLCGVPVLGVVPVFEDIAIEAEDSLALGGKLARADAANGRKNVAVVRLGHISNFTDFDALERDPRAHLYYTAQPEELLRADIIVVPGSKSTVADLAELRRNGAAEAILQAHARGATVLGICGGYQILGLSVSDPLGVEGGEGGEGTVASAPGLGLLPVETTLSAEKITRQRTFSLPGDPRVCTGYEIHNGRTTPTQPAEPVAILDDGSKEGCRRENALGTYLHGILDNPAFLDALLGKTADDPVEDPADHPAEDLAAFKNRQYDRLADHVRRHVDIAQIYRLLC